MAALRRSINSVDFIRKKKCRGIFLYRQLPVRPFKAVMYFSLVFVCSFVRLLLCWHSDFGLINITLCPSEQISFFFFRVSLCAARRGAVRHLYPANKSQRSVASDQKCAGRGQARRGGQSRLRSLDVVDFSSVILVAGKK